MDRQVRMLHGLRRGGDKKKLTNSRLQISFQHVEINHVSLIEPLPVFRTSCSKVVMGLLWYYISIRQTSLPLLLAVCSYWTDHLPYCWFFFVSFGSFLPFVARANHLPPPDPLISHTTNCLHVLCHYCHA